MTAEEGEQIAKEIRRRLTFQLWLTVALWLVVILVVLFVWRTSARNATALCALRTDVQLRVSTTEEQVAATSRFLAEHPNGTPGFSAAAIRASLDGQRSSLEGQRRTVAALSGLKCPPLINEPA